MGLESIMIPNFFKTLGSDIEYVINNFSKRETDEQRRDFTIAIIRLSGAALMGSGLFCAIQALPILASSAGVAKLAIGIASYIVGHDFFRMGNNVQSHFNGYAFITAGKSIFRSFFSIEDRTNDTLIEDLTRNTILPWEVPFKAVANAQRRA